MARTLHRRSAQFTGTRAAALVCLTLCGVALTTSAVAQTRYARTGKPRMVMMEVTAYCSCSKCCGPDAKGITASGQAVSSNAGAFAAADTNVLPFHTRLKIPGYAGGKSVEVLDRGAAIKGNRLDVFFPTHVQAKAWGRRRVAVTVFE